MYSDPEILSGKPVVKGTRLSVDFLLELFANGWSEEQVLESYPNLTQDSLLGPCSPSPPSPRVTSTPSSCEVKGCSFR